ncbi:MAG: hypothetical protein LHW64_08555 [Candidatus Cloacimonetes bacterium]|jgi:hypothetical protein|nr:hypothetical protein [Candidatus Cloacimonadota bacterium]MCB5287844.1 hypothetical protein [Candidatus Cloacimonadota bacterium]MCK9185034.1 hypothetical protein [Candidatus Cloacimonadota bacterium]MCK9584140.1 hypothetical protein [Candidatus Cloacimonadota bacterium]MDY0230164.1 hypothetical protein [Candidatus Cloacimonadaceae bacterium]
MKTETTQRLQEIFKLLSAEGSLFYSEEGWKWDEHSGIFSCLSELSKPGSKSIALTRQWRELISALA